MNFVEILKFSLYVFGRPRRAKKRPTGPKKISINPFKQALTSITSIIEV